MSDFITFRQGEQSKRMFMIVRFPGQGDMSQLPPGTANYWQTVGPTEATYKIMKGNAVGAVTTYLKEGGYWQRNFWASVPAEVYRLEADRMAHPMIFGEPTLIWSGTTGEFPGMKADGTVKKAKK